MVVFIKLGGSLITDKLVARSFRRDVARDIAAQLAQIRAERPALRILLGHGSGSFGHFEARKYDIVHGIASEEQRLAHARVGAVAAELTALVRAELLEAGLPALRYPPSALLTTSNRRIDSLTVGPLRVALEHGYFPLTHGDIMLDKAIGGAIISTEAVFAALAEPLGATEIILLGEVDGVLDADGSLVPRVTPQSLPALLPTLGASHGVDVTGGMLHKVAEMVELIAQRPSLSVTIANGRRDGILLDMLLHRRRHGTRIAAAQS